LANDSINCLIDFWKCLIDYTDGLWLIIMIDYWLIIDWLLIDYDWLWLIMIDYDWLWLIMMDCMIDYWLIMIDFGPH